MPTYETYSSDLARMLLTGYSYSYGYYVEKTHSP